MSARVEHCRRWRWWLLVLLPATLAACSLSRSDRGVEALWHDGVILQPGKTTRNEVMARLGPPSQMLALPGESVLYYMHERGRGRAIKLIVYNYREEVLDYDRAVFFFDLDGLLKEYSLTDAPR